MTATLQELTDAFTRLLAGQDAGGGGQPGLAVEPPASPASDGGDPAASVVPGVQLAEFARRGWHLDVTVDAGQVPDAATLMDRRGFALDAVTGVDWLGQNQMEVVYDFFHLDHGLRVAFRCRIPRDRPEVPTISSLFPGANWHEREAHEFFGIRFLGHPNLVPLLLPEDADYHPLRKDFSA